MSSLSIQPLTASIGAEIRGVDLRAPLCRDDVRAIEQALLDHLVVFFRDQDISDDQQLDFARHFGEVSIPPFTPRAWMMASVTSLA